MKEGKFMKKSIKVLCLILAFVCMLSTTSVAFASPENVGLTDSPSYLIDGGISTYDGKKPTDVWNMTTMGKYTFSGDTCGGYLYTLYRFTSTWGLKITVTNDDPKYEVNVVVYECRSLFDKDLADRTIKPGDTLTFTVNDLNFLSEYYVRFSSASKVHGTISKPYA